MKKAKFIWYLLTIIPIILLILGYIFPSQFFWNQEAIRTYVNQFWVFAPVVFIAIQALQVIITPLSHYTISIAGWFIFGTWLWFIYNWIGRVIWTTIAFYLWSHWDRLRTDEGHPWEDSRLPQQVRRVVPSRTEC